MEHWVMVALTLYPVPPVLFIFACMWAGVQHQRGWLRFWVASLVVLFIWPVVLVMAYNEWDEFVTDRERAQVRADDR